MLTQAQNESLTQTGPQTPGGRMMRRYWMPVALAEELPPNGPPLGVRLLSEDLELVRNAAGKPAVCNAAYPCVEAGRLILAYLGPGAPPPLPAIPFLHAPDGHVWCSKILHDCNYLQGSEGNVDSQHVSFLHRVDLERTWREAARIIYADGAPELIVEETDFGFRTYTQRNAGPDRVYVRVTNFIMPNCSAFVGSPRVDPRVTPPDDNDGCQHHWHVPIDDEHHWKYLVSYRASGPVDRDYLSRRIVADTDGSYHMRRHAGNRYLQDRGEMVRGTFSGMGTNFLAHDKFATESQRPISDRTREHLGTTDRGVILMRRQLLDAIADVEAGREPLLLRRRDGVDPLAEMVVRAAKLPSDRRDVRGFWREPAAAP
jgi:phthalate 4,5-dioxygenase